MRQALCSVEDEGLGSQRMEVGQEASLKAGAAS